MAREVREDPDVVARDVVDGLVARVVARGSEVEGGEGGLDGAGPAREVGDRDGHREVEVGEEADGAEEIVEGGGEGWIAEDQRRPVVDGLGPTDVPAGVARERGEALVGVEGPDGAALVGEG